MECLASDPDLKSVQDTTFLSLVFVCLRRLAIDDAVELLAADDPDELSDSLTGAAVGGGTVGGGVLAFTGRRRPKSSGFGGPPSFLGVGVRSLGSCCCVVEATFDATCCLGCRSSGVRGNGFAWKKVSF